MRRRGSMLLLALLLLSGCTQPVAVAPRASLPAVEPTETIVLPSDASTAPAASPAAPASATTAAEPLKAIEPRLIEHGSRDSKTVALTFDLCERENDTAGFQSDIVEYLQAEKLPATFFVGGKWARSHPDAARLLGGIDLFEIGQHSWSHPHFPKLSAEEQRDQLARAQEEVARLTGKTPRVFRFPYGESDAQSLKAVGDLGLVAVGWDDDTGDPDHNQTPKVILADVKRHLKPGSIILMHANGRGYHTREALPLLVGYLRDHGYRFVTASEMADPAE